MSDDKSKPGGRDRELISLGEDYEVRDAAEAFGVTPDDIREAVRKVGNRRVDVEKYLADRDLP